MGARGDAGAVTVVAAVVADSGLVSDPVLRQSRGSAQYLYATMLWLVGSEELAGERETEEDVENVHSRDETRNWFLLTIFGMPFLLGGGGLMRSRVRRRRRLS